MKRVLKISILTVLFMFGMVMNAAASDGATSDNTIHYVALGDSIAAGVTFNGQLGTGYTDLIKKGLEEKGLEVEFQRFAVPGYKSENILADLSKPEIVAALAKADVVTVTVGANDMLQIAEVSDGKVSFDLSKAKDALTKATENIGKIVGTIKSINPTADVYVTDYIFPFPYLEGVNFAQVSAMMEQMNSSLLAAGKIAGAKTVSVHSLVGLDTKSYMPNPNNVHPNEVGYQKIAEAFFDAYHANDIPSYMDVKGHWAEKEITTLIGLGYIKGNTETEFKPEQAITRAEAASYLYTMIPLTKSDPTNIGFTDVSENHPQYMAIAKLTDAGIFSKAEKFNPDASLTRAQFAKIAAIAFQMEADDKKVAFTDVRNGYWGEEYITILASNGYLNGYKDGSFGISKETTRAQFAVVVYRILEKNK